MGVWQTIKAAFALGATVPPDARRLNAVDVFALSASLEALLVEERGWITLSEARALFSPMDDQYRFREMDEIGRANLAAFAAQSEHLCDFDLMPVEGRVYFTRTHGIDRYPSALAPPGPSATLGGGGCPSRPDYDRAGSAALPVFPPEGPAIKPRLVTGERGASKEE
jgi:hypothetical protein